MRALVSAFLIASSLVLVYSCKDDNEDNAANDIQLFSFGPSVLRGQQLRFIGTNLDKVTSIVLPVNVEVPASSFKTVTASEITIDVPDAATEGLVTLKTPNGDVVTKTSLSILEPITITSISPATVKPGGKITIEGTYLNLISTVTFADGKAVTDFVSQSRTKLEVIVPADAKTGIVILNDSEKIPNVIKSETELTVVLPVVTNLLPSPVKAGQNVTITGTDLHLVNQITFNGGASVTAFVSKSETEIVLAVPADAKEGVVTLGVASKVPVQSTKTITLVVPTLTTVTPNPAKNKSMINVKGTDLDLISKVVFGGSVEGEIQSGGTSTDITVKVPDKATSGVVVFSTKGDKSVSSPTLALVKPTITSIAPLAVQMDNDITITGTNLDLVSEVRFAGDTKTTVTSASPTQLVVKVPLGTKTGAITLVTINADQVVSTDQVTILANVPEITNITAMAKPGGKVTITGVKLNLTEQVIFPDNVKATQFGNRTATQLEVYVPELAKKGKVKIKLVTYDNQQTETPEITISGVDPVTDVSLVFFNFDGLDRWWGDTGANENNSALSLNGTNYFRVNANLTNWTGYFWRNGKNGFPASAIGTDVNNYVLKFDINVLEPITGGEFAWRLKGTDGDFFASWKPWAETGSYQTDGWITVTIPISDFADGSKHITDLNTISEDFGVAFNAGTSKVNVAIDNVRFQHK